MSATPRPSIVPASSPARPVRSESWRPRCFYASQCRFFIDVPLDMTGCIHGAIREAVGHGRVLVPGGVILATDALFRGAVLVEIEDDGEQGHSVVRMKDTSVLARDLPERAPRLRQELDELVRWAIEFGDAVSAVYVRYVGVGPFMRPNAIFAAVQSDSAM